jgi:hypothetical protein
MKKTLIYIYCFYYSLHNLNRKYGEGSQFSTNLILTICIFLNIFPFFKKIITQIGFTNKFIINKQFLILAVILILPLYFIIYLIFNRKKEFYSNYYNDLSEIIKRKLTVFIGCYYFLSFILAFVFLKFL